jgi:protein TonB
MAKEMGIEGKCYIRFVVTETGKITDVKVARGIPGGEMCDKEAQRVIRMMPDWKPGKNRGKAVSCYVTMPVAFKLTQ